MVPDVTGGGVGAGVGGDQLIHLIIGGARSGKSAYAEQCALAIHKKPFYLATAEAGDEEMSQRIARHQGARDARWHLLEEPLHLAERMTSVDDENHIVLIDCLTLWLSNCLQRSCWEQERALFIEKLCEMRADVLLVCNEVGSGVIPMGELSRVFVDESGWLQQDLARVCSHVTLVMAGLPLALKSEGTA